MALIQTVGHEVTSGNTNTVTLTSTTAGNLLVAFLHTEDGGTSTFTMPANWTQVGSTVNAAGDNASAMYYYVNNPGGITSVACQRNNSNGFPFYAIILEYSGMATASVLDTNHSANGSSTNPDPGSMTTTNANDLLIVAGGSDGPSSMTGVTSGWTLRHNPTTSNYAVAIADRSVTATGAYDPALTAANGIWGAIQAAFKTSSGSTVSVSASASIALLASGVSKSAAATIALKATGVTKSAAATIALKATNLSKDAGATIALKQANVSQSAAATIALLSVGNTKSAAASIALFASGVSQSAASTIALKAANLTKDSAATIALKAANLSVSASATIALAGVGGGAQSASATIALKAANLTKSAAATIALLKTNLSQSASATIALKLTGLVQSAGATIALKQAGLTKSAAAKIALRMNDASKDAGATIALKQAGLTISAAATIALIPTGILPFDVSPDATGAQRWAMTSGAASRGPDGYTGMNTAPNAYAGVKR